MKRIGQNSSSLNFSSSPSLSPSHDFTSLTHRRSLSFTLTQQNASQYKNANCSSQQKQNPFGKGEEQYKDSAINETYTFDWP